MNAILLGACPHVTKERSRQVYIIVAGGGKVGHYLTKTLLLEGHEVLVIEIDPRKASRIEEELGEVVLQGDACEATTLEGAGAQRADVVIAVTGADERNLVTCQLAKRKFGVGRTIARINNPANEPIFRVLGIDVTISSTQLIMSQIEQEIPATALSHLLTLRHADLEVVEAKLAPGSRVVGQSVRDLPLPPGCVLPVIIRNGETLVPGGETVLQVGDEVIAITKTASEDALRELLFRRA